MICCLKSSLVNVCECCQCDNAQIRTATITRFRFRLNINLPEMHIREFIFLNCLPARHRRRCRCRCRCRCRRHAPLSSKSKENSLGAMSIKRDPFAGLGFEKYQPYLDYERLQRGDVFALVRHNSFSGMSYTNTLLRHGARDFQVLSNGMRFVKWVTKSKTTFNDEDIDFNDNHRSLVATIICKRNKGSVQEQKCHNNTN
uniref:Uncharacterized protein n=1 Tax=Glossina austeni TaxID=7395 RepID=A0A1A9UF66_GLOAU